MTLRCNGEPIELPEGATVQALLERLSLARPGVAVAINLRVIARSTWGDTRLQAGDAVEIIQAVGGG